MVGRTISHYRIVGQLGTGGMGVVYSAEDLRLGRGVALKFVSDDLAGDPAALQRLRSEARAASALNHPNICTIYDIDEDEGHPFIVMELMKGQSLRERLASGPLRVHELVSLGIEVADALESAHEHGIVHRDVKPGNLFITDRGHAKVLDFGLAKVTTRSPDASTTVEDRTAQGLTLGTVSYMSPEQASGEVLDGRTDLFSLGVVFYEAATGHHPFTGKTTGVVLAAILSHAPVAPATYNPDLPQRLQEVINNCLEKDRELRYQSAADLRADLRRVKRDLESGQSRAVATLDRTASSSGPTPSPSSSSRSTPAAVSSGTSDSPTAPRRFPPTGTRVASLVVVALLAAASYAAWTRVAWFAPAPVQQSAIASLADASMAEPLRMAEISLASRNYRAAFAYASEVLAVSPGHVRATAIRDEARALQARVDAAVGDARRELAAGDLAAAARALQLARALDPTSPSVSELAAQLSQQVSARAMQGEARDTGPVATVVPRGQPVRGSREDVPASGRARGSSLTATSGQISAVPTAQSAAGSASAVTQADPPSRWSPTSVPPTSIPSPSTSSIAPAALTSTLTTSAAPSTSTIVPVAPRPDARTEPREDSRTGTPAGAGDEAAIRGVVAAYARAIENKDLSSFRTLKPNLSREEERRLRDGFRAVSSQRVHLTVVSLDLRGDRASVTVRRRDTIDAGGREQTSERGQTLTLSKAGTSWVIVDIR